MGKLALSLGCGAEADEGCFRNKLYISALNTTKGKMIDWIQEHIYLGVQKKNFKASEHQHLYKGEYCILLGNLF